MSVDQWNGNGNWVTNASTDWSTDAPPTSTEVAWIESGTVTLTTSSTVWGVAITNGATLSVTNGGSLTATGGLTNFGAFNLDTGNTGGTANVGAVDNFGTITIGNSGMTASTTMTVGTLAITGQIILWGNETLGTSDQATLDITGAAPTYLTGTISLHGDSLLEVTGGITGIGAGGALDLDGAQSRVSLGNGTTNSGLSGLTSNAGSIDFEGDSGNGAGGASLTTSVGLTNANTVNVDTFGGDGGSFLNIGGTLTNTGALNIGNTALSGSTEVEATGLTNSNSIVVQGNAASGTTDQATLEIAAATPATLFGNLSVRGDALVAFTGGGSVQTVAHGALLELDGNEAAFQGGTLSDLSEVDGQLLLRGDSSYGAGGTKLTTSVSLTNTDAVNVDTFGGDGGSFLDIGGTLTNTGALNIGNTALSGSTEVEATGLTNGNAIVVQGNAASGTTDQATLEIAAATPTTLFGNLSVRGDALVAFTGGGSVQTIAAGALLELDGNEARFRGGTLSDLSEVNGQLLLRGDSSYGAGGTSLTTSVGLTNANTVDVDTFGGDGGSFLDIGGTLTNTGALNIGNTSLSGSTEVEATGLTNSNSIVVQGNNASGTTDQATLEIAAATPTTLSASWIVRGDALVAFTGGGSVQTIAAGALLELDGADARFRGGTLSDLSEVNGELLLRGDSGYGAGGTSLTTSVGLTNTNTVNVDTFGGDGGSVLDIGGTLTNTGALNIGNTALSGSTEVEATGLTNSNSIVVQGNNASGTTDQATLEIAAATPTTLSASWIVRGDALVAFTGGGSVQTIAAGALLELDGNEARFRGGTLSDLSEVNGQLLLRGDSSYGAGGTSLTTSVGLTNANTVNVDTFGGDGGSFLNIGGTLTNTGALNIGNTALSGSTEVEATGLTNGNSIVVQGNNASGTTEQATLEIAAATPTTLFGNLSVRGDALVAFTGGGSVQTIAAGALLELDGADARFRSGTLSDLSQVDGQLLLRGDSGNGAGGTSLTTSVGLTNANTVNVDTFGGDGGSFLNIGGTLTNTGALNIGNTALSGSTEVEATGLTNGNAIVVQGNAASGTTEQATLEIAAATPTTLFGNLSVRGDALVAFTGGGSVQTIAAGALLELDGADARFRSGTLSDLSQVDGQLLLRGDSGYGAGGTSLTTSVGLTNTNTVNVDTFGGDGGSVLDIGGTLTNTGALNIGNTALSGSTEVEATGLTNSNSIVVQGNNASGTTDQATLEIAAATPTTLSASWIVRGDALVAFTGGGSVQTIAAGALLELDGNEARFRGGTLSDLSEVNGQLLLRGDSGNGAGGTSLATSVGLTNANTVNVDTFGGDGGSFLNIGGTLTNTGALNIGNTALSGSTEVEATGLTNGNSIVVQGNNASGTTEQATLEIAAATPATLFGNLSVRGDALVAFTGGGSVQTIAAGALLELDGAEARFAGGNLSNLSEVNGQLLLRGDSSYGAGGTSLTTSVGLTIGGTVNVDPDGGDGGSVLNIGGTLTNTGALNIGNGDLSAGTEVRASALVNNGSITLGGNGGNEGELLANGTATNSGTVSIFAGGYLNVETAYTQTQGQTTVAGLLTASTVNANGGLINFTAALTSGDGTGALDIGAAGTLEMAGVDSSHTVTFEASTGTLDLSAPGSFAGTIAGFSSADAIDLLNTTVTSLSFASGTLTVKNGAATVASLNFSGSYTTDSFAFGSDGNGGTYIVDPPSDGSPTVASKTANLVHAMASFGHDSGGNQSPLPTTPSLSQDLHMLAASAHG